MKNFLIQFLCISSVAFSQKNHLTKTDFTSTLFNSGLTDTDSIQIEISSERITDFEIRYKNGDTLLWQMISNNAGAIFLARREVDSLIISSNYYPPTRFAFDDYPLAVLEITYKQKSGLDRFNSVEVGSLKEDFLADPTGCKGLREKHVTTNFTETLFDNQSIIGLTKQELVELIGEPNEIDGKVKRMKLCTDSGNQRFEYFISICGEQQTGYSIGVSIRNNMVVGTVVRMYCG